MLSTVACISPAFPTGRHLASIHGSLHGTRPEMPSKCWRNAEALRILGSQQKAAVFHGCYGDTVIPHRIFSCKLVRHLDHNSREVSKNMWLKMPLVSNYGSTDQNIMDTCMDERNVCWSMYTWWIPYYSSQEKI